MIRAIKLTCLAAAFALFGLAVGLPLAASGALKGLKSSAATFIRFISAGVFRYVDHRTVNFWGVILMGVSTLLIPVLPTFGVLVVLFAINGVCRGLLRVTSSATVAEVRSEGHDVGIAHHRLDLARPVDAHRPMGRAGSAHHGRRIGPRVQARLDQDHPSPGNREAAQQAQHLVGLAAEHAAAYHVHPAGRVEHRAV